MTTPAINVDITSPGVLHERFYANGVLLSDNSYVVSAHHVTDSRPASVLNPIRSDGTRQPSSWGRAGGSMRGVSGTFITRQVVSPDVYERVWQGQLAAPGLIPGNIPLLAPDGEIAAIRKALGRLGEAEVQLGASMREARQTADMVGKYYRHGNTLAGKLMEAVQGSKRVRQQFRDFLAGSWKDVPSAYLEYLFGMKPLADDISNAVQVLTDNKQNGGRFNMTLKGRVQEADVFESPSYQSWVNPVAVVYGTQSVTQVSKASLNFSLPDWYWDRLPPVTFFRENWETTGLSFVLDWVLPVDQWLMGFEGNQLRPFFREGSRSTYLRRAVESPSVPDPRWIPDKGSGVGQDFSYSRVAFDSFPTEELFQLPRLTGILNLDELRVGSAILGQRLIALGRAVRRI